MLGGDYDAARHLPPLREAVAAAADAGMLGDKHGMSAPTTNAAAVR